MTDQRQKNNLGMAGEYRVLSELLLKGFDASITMGNAKGTDIIVFGKNKQYIRIEVKTSKNGGNFVTSYFPKYTLTSEQDPDLWILFLPKEVNKQSEDIFYILIHSQVRELQLVMNKGNITERGKGVDNISLKLLQDHDSSKNNWGLLNDLV